MVVDFYRHRTKDFLTESSKTNYERTSGQLTICTTARAVKKFLTSRLVMNSRQLWNSHQRNKFLRAEASKDILQFRVLEMGFLGVFKRYFPLRTLCYFVRIHARLRDKRSTLQGDATFLLGPVWDYTKAAHLEVGRRVEWAHHSLITNGLFFLAGLNGWVGQKPNWTHDKSHLEQIWPVSDWKGAATLQRTAQPAMEWLWRQREWS